MRFQRRAAAQSPEMAKALLDAYKQIRDTLSPAEIERLITSGQLDRIIDDATLDRAVIKVRERIVESVQQGFKATVQDLPKAGVIDGQMAVMFDTLNPRVIDAVRALDSRVINTLKDEVRETVRAYVENGLRDGAAPKTIARNLRGVIGLAPNQELAVRNFENALRDGDMSKSLRYKLRDRRFDGTVRKGAYSPEQIERMTDAYRRKMESFNANTNARTATLDSLKLGQRMSWEDAAKNGIVDRSALMMKWITVGDARVRPEHVAMNGEEVPFDGAFSNGESIPGESTFNCRCLARVFVKRESTITP